MQYKYKCTEASEPNLYKDIYPYEQLPKYEFAQSAPELAIPEDIWVTDTTLRDGQQSMRAFTSEQSVQIYKYLHRIDNGLGVIRQCEFFVYNENDREAIRRAMALGYEFPQITTWIRASAGDFELVKSLGVKETGMLMSCSDYHIFKKLKKSRTATMEGYLEVAESALKAGIKPRCHLEDLTRADFNGFVIPLVKNLRDLCESYGVALKIRACDTLGVASPLPNAAVPRGVPAIMTILRNECGLNASQLEWHGHNDFHLSVANSLSAWLYGCSSVNTTLLGIGERCGNTPLEGMLFQYEQIKRDTTKSLDLPVLNEVADFFAETLEYDIHEKYPLMGADFNTTKAGIHADGLLKDPEIYNSFNTAKIFARPIIIMINQSSGSAGITGWINNYYLLKDEEKLDKRDERIAKIKEWVDNEYNGGRTSNISNEELRILVGKFIPELERRAKQTEMASTKLPSTD